MKRILSKLEKVQQVGKGRWKACCPAHEDSSPSLWLTEKGDGTILMHCFAGCESLEILDAIGLEFDALFPEAYDKPRLRKPYNAQDVLESIVFETSIVTMTLDRMFWGKDISVGDWERLKLAANRLNSAVELVNAK